MPDEGTAPDASEYQRFAALLGEPRVPYPFAPTAAQSRLKLPKDD